VAVKQVVAAPIVKQVIAAPIVKTVSVASTPEPKQTIKSAPIAAIVKPVTPVAEIVKPVPVVQSPVESDQSDEFEVSDVSIDGILDEIGDVSSYEKAREDEGSIDLESIESLSL
jgi:hypothetical protein